MPSSSTAAPPIVESKAATAPAPAAAAATTAAAAAAAANANTQRKQKKQHDKDKTKQNTMASSSIIAATDTASAGNPKTNATNSRGKKQQQQRKKRSNHQQAAISSATTAVTSVPTTTTTTTTATGSAKLKPSVTKAKRGPIARRQPGTVVQAFTNKQRKKGAQQRGGSSRGGRKRGPPIVAHHRNGGSASVALAAERAFQQQGKGGDDGSHSGQPAKTRSPGSQTTISVSNNQQEHPKRRGPMPRSMAREAAGQATTSVAAAAVGTSSSRTDRDADVKQQRRGKRPPVKQRRNQQGKQARPTASEKAATGGGAGKGSSILFVSNIPQKVTKHALLMLLSRFGHIDSIEYPAAAASSGGNNDDGGGGRQDKSRVCFVYFANASGVESAIKAAPLKCDARGRSTTSSSAAVLAMVPFCIRGGNGKPKSLEERVALAMLFAKPDDTVVVDKRKKNHDSDRLEKKGCGSTAGSVSAAGDKTQLPQNGEGDNDDADEESWLHKAHAALIREAAGGNEQLMEMSKHVEQLNPAAAEFHPIHPMYGIDNPNDFSHYLTFDGQSPVPQTQHGGDGTLGHVTGYGNPQNWWLQDATQMPNLFEQQQQQQQSQNGASVANNYAAWAAAASALRPMDPAPPAQVHLVTEDLPFRPAEYVYGTVAGPTYQVSEGQVVDDASLSEAAHTTVASTDGLPMAPNDAPVSGSSKSTAASNSTKTTPSRAGVTKSSTKQDSGPSPGSYVPPHLRSRLAATSKAAPTTNEDETADAPAPQVPAEETATASPGTVWTASGGERGGQRGSGVFRSGVFYADQSGKLTTIPSLLPDTAPGTAVDGSPDVFMKPPPGFENLFTAESPPPAELQDDHVRESRDGENIGEKRGDGAAEKASAEHNDASLRKQQPELAAGRQLPQMYQPYPVDPRLRPISQQQQQQQQQQIHEHAMLLPEGQRLAFDLHQMQQHQQQQQREYAIHVEHQRRLSQRFDQQMQLMQLQGNMVQPQSQQQQAQIPLTMMGGLGPSAVPPPLQQPVPFFMRNGNSGMGQQGMLPPAFGGMTFGHDGFEFQQRQQQQQQQSPAMMMMMSRAAPPEATAARAPPSYAQAASRPHQLPSWSK